MTNDEILSLIYSAYYALGREKVSQLSVECNAEYAFYEWNCCGGRETDIPIGFLERLKWELRAMNNPSLWWVSYKQPETPIVSNNEQKQEKRNNDMDKKMMMMMAMSQCAQGQGQGNPMMAMMPMMMMAMGKDAKDGDSDISLKDMDMFSGNPVVMQIKLQQQIFGEAPGLLAQQIKQILIANNLWDKTSQRYLVTGHIAQLCRYIELGLQPEEIVEAPVVNTLETESES